MKEVTCYLSDQGQVYETKQQALDADDMDTISSIFGQDMDTINIGGSIVNIYSLAEFLEGNRGKVDEYYKVLDAMEKGS